MPPPVVKPVDEEPPPHRRAKKPRRKMGEMNLTSMLDVVFQLLIFFILTASFAVGEGILAADLPSGEGPDSKDNEPPPTPIKIMLQSLGGDEITILVDQDPAPLGREFRELRRVLDRLQRNSSNPDGLFEPDTPVIIQPDSTIWWGHVVNAFNQALAARYDNVNFAQPSGN